MFRLGYYPPVSQTETHAAGTTFSPKMSKIDSTVLLIPKLTIIKNKSKSKNNPWIHNKERKRS